MGQGFELRFLPYWLELHFVGKDFGGVGLSSTSEIVGAVGRKQEHGDAVIRSRPLKLTWIKGLAKPQLILLDIAKLDYKI
jgi:hypothetical protein